MTSVFDRLPASLAVVMSLASAPAFADAAAHARLDLRFVLVDLDPLDGVTPSFTVPNSPAPTGSLADVFVGAFAQESSQGVAAATSFGSSAAAAALPEVGTAQASISGDVFGAGLAVSADSTATAIPRSSVYSNSISLDTIAGGDFTTFTLSAGSAIEVIGTYSSVIAQGGDALDGADENLYLRMGTEVASAAETTTANRTLQDSRRFDFTITNDSATPLTDTFRFALSANAWTGPTVVTSVPEAAAPEMLSLGLGLVALSSSRRRRPGGVHPSTRHAAAR